MKQIIYTFIFACLIAGGSTANALEATKAKTIGLLFYSESCGSCKVLDPKVEKVKASLGEKPVLFVKLDHSNKATSSQASLLVSALGVSDVYAKQQKASGYLLLVDAKSGTVIEKITKKSSEEAIKAAIVATL